MMGDLVVIILLIAIAALLILLRKKIFALIMDCIIGFIVYVVVIFGTDFLGLHIPPLIIDWALPVCILGDLAYHIISNYTKPRGKPWGAL